MQRKKKVWFHHNMVFFRMSHQEKDDKNENIFTPQKCNFVMEM